MADNKSRKDVKIIAAVAALLVGLILSMAYAAHYSRRLNQAEEMIANLGRESAARAVGGMEAELRAQLAELKMSLNGTEDQLAEAKRHLQTIESKWRLASEGLEPLSALIDSLKGEHLTLQREIAMGATVQTERKERIAELEQEISQLREQRDLIQRRADRLSSDINQARGRITDLENELSAARERLREQENRIASLDQAGTEARKSLEERGQLLSQLQKELAAATERAGELDASLQTAQRQRDELQQRYAAVEQSYSEYRETVERQIKSLREQVETLSSENTSLESRIKALQEEQAEDGEDN